MSLRTSNEFFINMDEKDIPRYDPNKHYFQQEKSTLDFYKEEFRKMKEGLNINGVFIHPWLYYHTNFFKTPIPQPDGTEPIMNPPLRDNELYMADTIHRAETHPSGGRGIAMFGTRRFAKSSVITSYLSWKALTKENASANLVGGDEEDINTMADYLKTNLTNIHPAFRLPTNRQDYTDKIIFGFKLKNGTPIEYSRIKVKNVNSGKQSSSEKTAGSSPSAFIIDEFAKFPCMSIYLAALASFETPHGWKCLPMLAGTGGNATLSQEAQTMLENPESFKLLTMDWDYLDNMVRQKSLITWKRRNFGVFVPAQMSYKTGLKKIETNLGEYLGNDDPRLKDIKFLKTDWKQSLEIIQKDRAALKDVDNAAYTKEKVYYPLDSLEPFLGRADNPFPSARATALKAELEQKGRVGRAVDIYRRENGTIGYVFSEKEVVSQFPYAGGIHDAPVVMFDEPPDEIPPLGLNVSGLDPYNLTEATTSSLGAFYVLRREGIIGDPMAGKILASYVSRPQVQDTFNRTCCELMEGFGAECLTESANTDYIRYVERMKKERYLAEALDLAKSINSKTKQSNRYGLYPSPKNKKHVIGRVINYANEQIVVGTDDNGEAITDLGIIRINDPHLLTEIINYREDGNYDRIIAFGHALAWAEYLDEMGSIPKTTKQTDNKRKKKVSRRSSFYTKTIRPNEKTL
jgi:hypothetical protein